MGELRELNEMQQAFVVAYTTDPACLGKIREAALAAGYSEHTAYEQGRRLVTLPHVKAAITKAIQDQISGPLATKALAVISSIMLDPEAPKGVRLDAAKSILDRAGHVSPRTPVALPEPGSKELKNMSPDQLAGVISQASAARVELEAQLRDITPSATAPQIEGRAVAIDGESSDS
jgi:hypothetical protein